jgi:hypothetical protein
MRNVLGEQPRRVGGLVIRNRVARRRQPDDKLIVPYRDMQVGNEKPLHDLDLWLRSTVPAAGTGARLHNPPQLARHLPCCLIGSNGEVPGPDEVFRIVSYEVAHRNEPVFCAPEYLSVGRSRHGDNNVTALHFDVEVLVGHPRY